MPNHTTPRHIIVTGFSGDNKISPIPKAINREPKPKKDKRVFLNLIEDMNDTFENRVTFFKKESTRRIRKVETRMDRLRRKMETTTKELKVIYHDQVIELEHTKKKLSVMLKNHKKDDENEWESYKQLFNADLNKFEKILGGFLENFKAKQAPTSNKKE